MWQQVPQNQGYTQLTDRTNPAAQAYARMALARNGIHVPPGADAAAMWRQFSGQRASLRAQAASQGPDPYEAGVNPSQPLGGPQVGTFDPGQFTPDEGGRGTFDPGQFTQGLPQIPPGPRLPEGGIRTHGIEGQPLPAGLGWHDRIRQMAAALSSANLQPRQALDTEFQHVQGGPAESVLQMRRIGAVHQAHQAAKNIASLLAARKPSRAFRSTHDPRAY